MIETVCSSEKTSSFLIWLSSTGCCALKMIGCSRWWEVVRDCRRRYSQRKSSGVEAGVTEGSAVIDSEGLFGQVIELGQFTSRVLLVADKDHAVPVEVNRNAVRSVAGGSGRIDRLELEFVPVTTDIKIGDLLVTSGLGGRFPRGYPVGTVQEVIIDPNVSFAVVNVLPAAQLDRSRHVLVVVGEPTPTTIERAGIPTKGDPAPVQAATQEPAQEPATGNAAKDGAANDTAMPPAAGSVQ